LCGPPADPRPGTYCGGTPACTTRRASARHRRPSLPCADRRTRRPLLVRERRQPRRRPGARSGRRARADGGSAAPRRRQHCDHGQGGRVPVGQEHYPARSISILCRDAEVPRCWSLRPRVAADTIVQSLFGDADALHKKTCKYGPFRKRLKGFEPSTFCMASRTPASRPELNGPANEPFSARPRRAANPGIYREITGVSGPKPDRAWHSELGIGERGG
jgi:hypothetical protein